MFDDAAATGSDASSSSGEGDEDDSLLPFLTAASLGRGLGEHYSMEALSLHAAVMGAMLRAQDEADLQDAMRRSTEEAYSGGFSVPPADEVAVARSTRTTTYRGTPNGEEPGQCSVCLDNFELGDGLRTLQCEHHFHVACVDQWLAQSGQCPVCKSRVGVV